MPRVAPDLRAELEALAAASAEALARLHGGDEHGLIALLERRERLLTVLEGLPPETGADVLDAARRAVAGDTELIVALRVRQVAVAREIDEVTRTRRSLASYGAGRADGAVYVERLG